MRHSVLTGTRFEAGNGSALVNANRQVLMPGHIPVRLRRFVEEDTVNGLDGPARDFRSEINDRRTRDEPSNLRRHFQQVANAAPGTLTSKIRDQLDNSRTDFSQSRDHFRRDKFFYQDEAVSFETVANVRI